MRRLDAMRAAAGAELLLPGLGAGDEHDAFSLALPGDVKIRYPDEKAPAVRAALGEAAEVWDDAGADRVVATSMKMWRHLALRLG